MVDLLGRLFVPVHCGTFVERAGHVHSLLLLHQNGCHCVDVCAVDAGSRNPVSTGTATAVGAVFGGVDDQQEGVSRRSTVVEDGDCQ